MRLAVVSFVVCVAAACGDSEDSKSDAGPVDAGNAECQEACEDAVSVEHLVEHLVGEG